MLFSGLWYAERGLQRHRWHMYWFAWVHAADAMLSNRNSHLSPQQGMVWVPFYQNRPATHRNRSQDCSNGRIHLLYEQALGLCGQQLQQQQHQLECQHLLQLL
jgi:hypothetical protein